MTRQADVSAAPIAGYVRAIRAHMVLFVAIVLTAVLASVVWGAVVSRPYEARAELLVSPIPDTEAALTGLPLIRTGGDPSRGVNTAASIVHSAKTARVASENLDGRLSPDQIETMVEVAPSESDNLVSVTAEGDDPELVAAAANAYVEAAIEIRRRELAPLVEAAIEATEDELAGLTDPESVRAQDLQARLAGLGALRDRPDPTLAIATEATAPSAPAGTDPKLVLLFALISGLAIAATTVVVMELLAPGPVEDEDQLRSAYPLPVLARVPRVRSGAPGPSGEDDAPPAFAEAFRTLRGQLELLRRSDRDLERRSPGDRPAVIGVVSPSAGDGKTTVAIGLAQAFRSTVSRALVIEMDARDAELASRLGLEPSIDLATALMAEPDLDPAITAVPGSPGLAVIAAPEIEDPRLIERIGTEGPRLIGAARGYADRVIIDMAALGDVGDALPLLQSVDQFIIVVRLGHTRLPALGALRETLGRSGLSPAGFVVIGSERAATVRGYTRRLRDRRRRSAASRA